MRFLKILGLGFAVVLAECPGTFGQTASGGNVAATWHFAGSAGLAGKTNFDNIKKILSLKTSLEFKDLVLNRFSGWLAGSLFPATKDGPASELRPLLDDCLSAESIWALGGKPDGPLNFIVALRLADQRLQAWQTALPKIIGAPGQSFKAQDYTGQQWKLAGGQSLWIIRAKDWLLAGSGDDLDDLKAQYVQQLSQNGRPAPAFKQSWLEADIDWPHLVHWLPDFPSILQLARTKITFTSLDQSILMKGTVTYPKPVPWKFDPWRIPTNIVRNPLVSFTAGQDIAAYLDPGEPLSKLTDNPLAGQFYVWALGLRGMAFQTFGAWPVADATNTLQHIATEAPAAFNPGFKEFGPSELRWQPEHKTLVWANLFPMLFPTLQVASETNGQYLLASLFPLNPGNKPAPDALYEQILGHTNLVYYDWEENGRRLEHWRLLSAMLPVLPRTPPALPPPVSTNKPATLEASRLPLVVVENWLSGITPMLVEKNTVTIVTRTTPAELAVARQSPFALTGLELVLLSHWLSGTGSPGINPGLLPPKAKVTGPGIKPDSP